MFYEELDSVPDNVGRFHAPAGRNCDDPRGRRWDHPAAAQIEGVLLCLGAVVTPRAMACEDGLYDTGERIGGLLQEWNRFKNAVVEVSVAVDGATGAVGSGVGVGGGLRSRKFLRTSSQTSCRWRNTYCGPPSITRMSS